MITTHVLDTAQGRPGRGIAIDLELAAELAAGPAWQLLASGLTDDDGRLRTLTPAGPVAPGVYRLRFATGPYYEGLGIASPFFPSVEIQFAVTDGAQHYHVPLLLSPFGYSTYRGS